MLQKTIPFSKVRCPEVVYWVDYLHKTFDNYVCEEIIETYAGKESTLSKDDIKELVLVDIYDNFFYIYPPVVDLVMLESALILGLKQYFSTTQRAMRFFVEYLLEYNESVRKREKEFRELLKLLQPTSRSEGIRDILTRCALELWRLPRKEHFVFCKFALLEVLTMISFLVKEGKRTIDDFNRYGFRITSINKFLVRRFKESTGTYYIKLKPLVESGLIEKGLYMKVMEEVSGAPLLTMEQEDNDFMYEEENNEQ